jgi:DNA-binding response OmpR family regulator
MPPTTEALIPNILLVEDDVVLAAMLGDALGSRRYCVWHAGSAAEAEALLERVEPDLILIDLMLPDKNGLVMCADLRARLGAPIIICSATRRKDDPVLGFKLGADDFVGKPFSVDELAARMELALRRAGSPRATESPPRPSTQRIGDLVIDPARCRVTLAGEPLHLTPTEYRLCCALASHLDAVVSRRELAERVWGHADAGIISSLDVHMRRLRAKLKAGARPGPHVAVVRGFGYQLVDGS